MLREEKALPAQQENKHWLLLALLLALPLALACWLATRTHRQSSRTAKTTFNVAPGSNSSYHFSLLTFGGVYGAPVAVRPEEEAGREQDVHGEKSL